MLYLAEIKLNKKNLGIEEIKENLCNMFNRKEKFLFAMIDKDKLIFQSSVKPDFSKLDEKYTKLLRDKTLNRTIEEGQKLHFRLTANPIRRESSSQKLKPIKHADLDCWLKRVFKNAASIMFVDIEDKKKISFIKRKTKNKVTLNTVTFSGIIKVENNVNLYNLIKNGIGHGKIYGCGLLMVW